jgi:DNA-binding NtrC family response regulator
LNESSEATFWIVHRESHARAAIARIAGAGDNTVLGAPSDDLFASASPPDVVLLAPSGDFESELQFAHRFASRTTDAQWIILADGRDLAEARRLFDILPARFIRYPLEPDALRRIIAGGLGARDIPSLSHRHSRDNLSARFKRWFIDLDIPDLLRALDPRLEHLPLLVRGEVGTGRGIVARYVHAFASQDDGPLAHVPCAGLSSERDILDFLASKGEGNGAARGAWRRTVWLEDVDCLAPAVQLRVRDWIEYGLPDGALRASRVRFIATATEPHESFGALESDTPRLVGALATALSGLVIELPALRARLDCIDTFVADAAVGWARARGERARSFSDRALRELRNYPWPGNMAQLEAAMNRTLSHTSANPIEPHHLKIQHESTPIFDDALPEAEIVEEAQPAATPAAAREDLAARGEVHAEVDNAPPFAAPEPQLETRIIEEPEPALPAQEKAPPVADLTPASPPSESAAHAPAHEPTAPTGEGVYRRLVGAVAHEVRNPLTSIRAFTDLLPEHYSDEEFRNRFAELVGADVRQIESVVERLERLANIASSRREVVDLPGLLDRVLDRCTATIQDRHLLVLKELERNNGLVIGDAAALETAFTGVFETAFNLVPERGDVYIASRYNALGFDGRASVRVLLRYHNPNSGRPLSDILSEAPPTPEGLSPAESSLEYLISEATIAMQGGNMTIDTTTAQETVIVIDIPAADPARG